MKNKTFIARETSERKIQELISEIQDRIKANIDKPRTGHRNRSSDITPERKINVKPILSRVTLSDSGNTGNTKTLRITETTRIELQSVFD